MQVITDKDLQLSDSSRKNWAEMFESNQEGLMFFTMILASSHLKLESTYVTFPNEIYGKFTAKRTISWYKDFYNLHRGHYFLPDVPIVAAKSRNDIIAVCADKAFFPNEKTNKDLPDGYFYVVEKVYTKERTKRNPRSIAYKVLCQLGVKEFENEQSQIESYLEQRPDDLNEHIRHIKLFIRFYKDNGSSKSKKYFLKKVGSLCRT